MAAKEWTAERVLALPIEEIKILRQNAIRYRNDAVASLCDEAMGKHANSRKASRVKTVSTKSSDESVVGFHFVCPGERGVTLNNDGTVWTGTWVVDTKHAETGSKIGSYVALHRAKSEPSYLQGILKDWRKAPRDSEYAEGQKVKIESGVDFLLELTPDPYAWGGDGTGEKGYVWAKP